MKELGSGSPSGAVTTADQPEAALPRLALDEVEAGLEFRAGHAADLV